MAAKPTVEMFMITCNERQRTRHATLASLGCSDWRSDLSLVLDPDITQPTGPIRMLRNFRRLLSQAARSRSQFVLLVEDDLDFNEHIEHNARAFAATLERDAVGALYQTTLSYKIGCQALLLHVVRAYELSKLAMLTSDKDLWPTDSWVRNVARVIQHTPSLVQHRDATSTWGAPRHRSASFSATWRHA